MEKGLRQCCRSIRIGKILIRTDNSSKEPTVYYARFPPNIEQRNILLLYPILGMYAHPSLFTYTHLATLHTHPHSTHTSPLCTHTLTLHTPPHSAHTHTSPLCTYTHLPTLRTHPHSTHTSPLCTHTHSLHLHILALRKHSFTLCTPSCNTISFPLCVCSFHRVWQNCASSY